MRFFKAFSFHFLHLHLIWYITLHNIVDDLRRARSIRMNETRDKFCKHLFMKFLIFSHFVFLLHHHVFTWCIGEEVRLTTTTTPSTTTRRTTTTTLRTTTLRTTTRRKLLLIPLTTTTTEQPTTTTAYELMPTEYELEFVTDYHHGSNSLFFPGVESYQHHINYISSQQSCHNDNCRLCRWILLVILLLFNFLRLKTEATSSWWIQFSHRENK